MATQNSIEFQSSKLEFSPLPIKPGWILEGSPMARFKVLSRSSDATARTIVWECSAGRFNWFYDIDETVYVLEGSATIKDPSGISREIQAGDSVLFRAGSHAEWTVEKYIRKVAFFRNPVPNFALLAIRIVRAARRLVGKGGAKADSPSMSNA